MGARILDEADKASDASVLPREQAIQFLMAHEQALEEGKPPLDPPVSLLSRLDSGDRTRLLQLISEQRKRIVTPRAAISDQGQGGVAVVPGLSSPGGGWPRRNGGGV